MACGSATYLISLAVLFYAPHFHYHNLMVSHYMMISNCHNKEPNFKNMYIHSGNTLGFLWGTQYMTEAPVLYTTTAVKFVLIPAL